MGKCLFSYVENDVTFFFLLQKRKVLSRRFVWTVTKSQMNDFTRQRNEASENPKCSLQPDNEYNFLWFWCWEVNDVHFEVTIHTQSPCDVLWWFRHACFHRHCNMNMDERKTACFDLKTCLLRRKNSTLPPTQCVVRGINQTKRENIFTFQICCMSKAPLSVGYALHRAGRQRIAQGEMTQVTNGWLGICSARKPIITGNMRVSQRRYSQLKRDLRFRCWNGLHMRRILHHMLNNWNCGDPDELLANN